VARYPAGRSALAAFRRGFALNRFGKKRSGIFSSQTFVLYLYYKIKEDMKELKPKEWMFTFEEGGWNTVWAKTRRGAVKQAAEEYKDSEGLTPRPGSFRVATEDGLERAMSLFW